MSMTALIIGGIILGASGGATIFIVNRNRKKKDKIAVRLEFKIGPILSKK